ncbi:MAG TPA: hypothetical protein VEL76_24855, partial [Gemmataceae bacterium]|nr:hypothetical protein [Gemmataceae bacterium]
MSRSLFASKRAKFLLALWVAAGGVLFVDRVLKRTHWIGSTKFELKLVVTDAETGQPIDKATLHVYSEGEWEPGDGKGAFRLE